MLFSEVRTVLNVTTDELLALMRNDLFPKPARIGLGLDLDFDADAVSAFQTLYRAARARG